MLNGIYFFMKVLLPTKQQIVFMSMQTNDISLDFQLLEDRLHQIRPKYHLVHLCKKMDSSLSKISDYIQYVFRMIGFTFKAMYYLATSKVCIAETYCVPISILHHKKNLKIVQIWHASGAVKKFGYQILDKNEGKKNSIAKLICMHQNYDYAIAPSNVTKQIFSEAFAISQDKIKLLGLPRLEYISNSQFDISNIIYQKYPEFKEKKIILYVPTFRKGKNVNLEEIWNTKMDKEKYELIIKLHPLDKTAIPKEYTKATEFKTYDLLKIADYIITDYSVLSIEASILKKPIFLYIYDWEEYIENRGINIDLLSELKSFTSKNFSDIIKKIETNDYQMEELKQYREKYIEIDTKHAIQKLTDFLIQVMENEGIKE